MNTALNRSGVFAAVNKSGGAVVAGDVLILGTATANAFTTTTTSGFVDGVVAVAMESIANNATGMIAVGVWVPKINLSSSATLYDFIKTHTVAGQGVRHAAPAIAGDFAIALGTGTSPAAIMWGFPNQGAGGGGGATIGTGSVASLPSPGTSGDLYLPNNGIQIYRSDGAAQFPWGPLFPFTAPDNSLFAWRNQGGASVDVAYGGIYLNAPPSTTDSLRVREIAYPATPFVLTIAIALACGYSTARGGLCIVDSASGKLEIIQAGDYTLQAEDYTNVTTAAGGSIGFTGGAGFQGGPCVQWMRMEDTGGGGGNLRKWSYSTDGQHFVQMASVSNTAFLTPDKIGFWANAPDANWPTGVNLLSWKLT